ARACARAGAQRPLDGRTVRRARRVYSRAAERRAAQPVAGARPDHHLRHALDLRERLSFLARARYEPPSGAHRARSQHGGAARTLQRIPAHERVRRTLPCTARGARRRSARMTRARVLSYLLPLLVAVAALGFWEWIVSYLEIQPFVLPPPSAIA